MPDFLLNRADAVRRGRHASRRTSTSARSPRARSQSTDGKSVEIKLPAPQLGRRPRHGKSYVFAEERGLFNRIGDVFGSDPNGSSSVYQLAEQRITEAARDSGLAQRAEENTRKMLEGLLRSLGYEKVTITYTAP